MASEQQVKHWVSSFAGCGDAKRFWYGRERPGEASEALPSADLWYDPVASQQQVGQGAPAGRGPDLAYRHRHEDLPGGGCTGIGENET